MAQTERLETYHDRIRETIVANLAPQVVKNCHRRLVEALEFAAETDPEELAVHYEAAGEVEKAAHHFADAAVQAAKALAFDRAATLYRSALRLATEDVHRSRNLRIGLAEALANAGRGTEAADEYLNVAQVSDPAESFEFQRLGAMHLLFAGHIDEGLEQLESVLRKLGMRLIKAPWCMVCSLLLYHAWLRIRGLQYRERAISAVPPDLIQKIDTCWSAAAGLGIVDPIHAAVFSSRGLLLALQAGEPHRLAQFLAIEAAQAASSGPRKPHRSQQLLNRAEIVSKGISSPHVEALMQLSHAMVNWLHGNWRPAERFCEDAIELLRTRCTGVWWEMNTAQTIVLDLAHFMGKMRKYARCRSDIILQARNRGDLYSQTIAGSMIIPVLAADEPNAAEDEVNKFVSQWSRSGFHIQHFYAMYARIAIALYRGNGLAAWGIATDFQRLIGKTALLRVQILRILSNEMYARCALAAAETATVPKPLIRIAARHAKKLAHEGVTWATALSHLIFAGIVVGEDRHAAEMLLKQAAEEFASSQMGLHAAVSRWRLGESLGGDNGAPYIAEANKWMREQGIRNPVRMTALFAPMPFCNTASES